MTDTYARGSNPRSDASSEISGRSSFFPGFHQDQYHAVPVEVETYGDHTPKNPTYEDSGTSIRRKPVPLVSTERAYTPAPRQDLILHSNASGRDRWRIHWASVAIIITLFLAGVVFALCHHFYYRSLNGHFPSPFDQEWAVRIGTGLAFLTKACLTAAAGLAYIQYCWRILRRNAVTIGGIDNMLGALSDITTLFSLDMIRGSWLAAVLAFVIWCIPLAAIAPPAALTVMSANSTSTTLQSVPQINWVSGFPLQFGGNGYVQAVGEDVYRISTATAYGASILPVDVGKTNFSYPLRFWGPSLKCGPLEPVDRTAFITTFSSSQTNSHYFNAVSAYNISLTNYSLVRSEYTWGLFIWTPSQNITCWAWNATFDTVFEYQSGVQNIKVSNVTFDLQLKSNGGTVGPAWGDDASAWGFEAWWEPLLGIIKGAIYNGGVMDTTWVQTQILRTSAAACPELGQAVKRLADNYAQLQSLLPCPGNSLSRALEEISQNMTMSFFSYSPALLPQNQTALAPVTVRTNRPVFSYNFNALILSYGIAVIATLGILLFGFYAIWTNGVYHNSSFSAIMCSTRNTDLDEIARGCSLAALPTAKGVKNAKLQFGVLSAQDVDIGHAAFGVEGTISRLKRGQALL